MEALDCMPVLLNKLIAFSDQMLPYSILTQLNYSIYNINVQLIIS